jgi:hypothetical protein
MIGIDDHAAEPADGGEELRHDDADNGQAHRCRLDHGEPSNTIARLRYRERSVGVPPAVR